MLVAVVSLHQDVALLLQDGVVEVAAMHGLLLESKGSMFAETEGHRVNNHTECSFALLVGEAYSIRLTYLISRPRRSALYHA